MAREDKSCRVRVVCPWLGSGDHPLRGCRVGRASHPTHPPRRLQEVVVVRPVPVDKYSRRELLPQRPPDHILHIRCLVVRCTWIVFPCGCDPPIVQNSTPGGRGRPLPPFFQEGRLAHPRRQRPPPKGRVSSPKTDVLLEKGLYYPAGVHLVPHLGVQYLDIGVDERQGDHRGDHCRRGHYHLNNTNNNSQSKAVQSEPACSCL